MDYISIAPFDFFSPDYAESIHLRDLILRKPLDMSFSPLDLEKENDSWHLACWDEKEAMVACLILKPIDAKTIKMRQVAVDNHMQGKGIGKKLVKYSESFAREKKFSIMELHARKSAVSFYLGLGYEIKGPEFMEVGIPHFYMFKILV